jgi:hypothetical protein
MCIAQDWGSENRIPAGTEGADFMQPSWPGRETVSGGRQQRLQLPDLGRVAVFCALGGIFSYRVHAPRGRVLSDEDC